jgi:hypothetical protein
LNVGTHPLGTGVHIYEKLYRAPPDRRNSMSLTATLQAGASLAPGRVVRHVSRQTLAEYDGRDDARQVGPISQ